jgi:hypothetical protein
MPIPSSTINGVHIQKSVDQSVLHIVIESFTSDLENLIRSSLNSICFGQLGITQNSKAYSYEKTIKHFYERFKGKTEKTQKGMIGELVTHFFIMKEMTHLKATSPFFNMEEMSIRKGFDVLYFQEDGELIWLSEVKSGGSKKGSGKEKTNALIAAAKKDIQAKLSSGSRSLWQNAVNAANASMVGSSAKDRTIEILHEIINENDETAIEVSDKNVILSSVLYCDVSDRAELKLLEEIRSAIHGEALFSNVILISIQKGTYEKVREFLKKEAGC